MVHLRYSRPEGLIQLVAIHCTTNMTSIDVDSIVAGAEGQSEITLAGGVGTSVESEDDVKYEDGEQRNQAAVVLQHRVDSGRILSQFKLGFPIDVLFFLSAPSGGDSVRSMVTCVGLIGGVDYAFAFSQ
jgi:hypothetical protein